MRTRQSQQAESSAPRWRSTKVGQVAFLRKARTYLAIAAITIIVSLGFGELYLRVAYSQGMSFSAKNGPLVARFERDFRFNRYDGPSRGPEVVGPKGENDVRILIQGESITWGQGVKNERSLYSSVLRERWRSISPNVEVAVLAGPGREIDGHLEQLGKWGDEIVPDVIVYQWFINDLELDKSHRPGGDRGWRRLFSRASSRDVLISGISWTLGSARCCRARHTKTTCLSISTGIRRAGACSRRCFTPGRSRPDT